MGAGFGRGGWTGKDIEYIYDVAKGDRAKGFPNSTVDNTLIGDDEGGVRFFRPRFLRSSVKPQN